MIPKKLHYCWFGEKPMPGRMKRCMESWHRYCPDWEICCWNESNFDTNQNGYTRMCMERKQYAFLSDYVRLWAVAQFGGVYLDADVELLRSIDGLLEKEAFFGFETPRYVASGLGFGSVAHGAAVEAMLREYEPLLSGTMGVRGCPALNTAALCRLGLVPNGQMQTVAGAVILPPEALNPYDSATGRLRRTENTYAIHWYQASWMEPGQRLRRAVTRPFHRIFGEDCFRWLKRKNGF